MSFQEDVKATLGDIQKTQIATLKEQASLRTTLTGMNGDEGMAGDMKIMRSDIKEHIERTESKIGKLQAKVWWLIGVGSSSVAGIGSYLGIVD